MSFDTIIYKPNLLMQAIFTSYFCRRLFMHVHSPNERNPLTVKAFLKNPCTSLCRPIIRSLTHFAESVPHTAKASIPNILQQYFSARLVEEAKLSAFCIGFPLGSVTSLWDSTGQHRVVRSRRPRLRYPTSTRGS